MMGYCLSLFVVTGYNIQIGCVYFFVGREKQITHNNQPNGDVVVLNQNVNSFKLKENLNANLPYLFLFILFMMLLRSF